MVVEHLVVEVVQGDLELDQVFLLVEEQPTQSRLVVAEQGPLPLPVEPLAQILFLTQLPQREVVEEALIPILQILA